MSALSTKSKRALWSVGLLAVVLAFSTVYLVHYYGETRPTAAQVEIGRTHPATIHGRTVYLTTAEYAFAFGTHVIAIVAIGVFVGMLLKASRRQASER